MRLRSLNSLYRIAVFLGVVMAFLSIPLPGYASSFTQYHVSHSNVQNAGQDIHPADNGILQWPFSPNDGPWNIEQGYNASSSPDHNCNPRTSPDHCYEIYGFDFQVTNGLTGGKTVYSPASGTVIGHGWPAYNNEGQCFAVALGSSAYVQVCHVDFYNNQIGTTVTKGLPVGTVDPGANHIHINLFTSANNGTAGDPTQRYPLAFSDPWMIGGCDYPVEPGNPSTTNGWYSGQGVPCANQGSAPILTFHWGDSSSPLWSGINLNRPVYVEVNSGSGSPDIFGQSVTTDGTGTATITLNGVTPGPYLVYLKPQGFLRQVYPSVVNLQPGNNNNLTFTMTQSGTNCTNGQPTGPQLWAGDVDGNNVINAADYSAIVSFYGQAPPSGYVDIDGDGVFDGIDYNLWLRSVCYFGNGQGEVVGDGGRSDTPIGQAARKTISKVPTSSGTISLSPANGSYRVNQSFSVNIQANSSGLQLDGADMVVHYDPTVLKVTNMVAGTIFADTPTLANNPAIGEINIGGIANKGQPVIVSGTLATIQFQVIGSGQTNVTLDFAQNSKARTGMTQDSTAAEVLGSAYSASFTAGMLYVPQKFPTISQALAAAQPGETVFVAPGTYYELLTVPAGVKLEGTNPANTIIDGSSANNTPVVHLGNGSTLTNFTIRHSGTTFWDAAVWADQGPVTITNNRILQNSMGIVRFCWSPPCNDTSTVTNNLVANNINTGILIHGAQANVVYNTVDNNHLQGITFEATGGQGISVANILTSNATGLTAPAPTTQTSDLLWKNTTTYGQNTSPGSSDILANPLYVKLKGNKYALHAVSPAISADGTLGAYAFKPVGKTPRKLKVTQNNGSVTLSWQSTGATGYEIYVAEGSNFFSRPVDVGNVTSYTFSSLPSGTVEFAVTSYNSSHHESLAVYVSKTIA
jgi:Cohesin domain/Periplasmic copper-binding protein (NosD)